MTNVIVCRARVADNCLDGRPSADQFFGEDLPLTEDGTYVRTPEPGGSIVCDPCYVALMPLTASGRGLNHELPAAIAMWHQAHRPEPPVPPQHPDKGMR